MTRKPSVTISPRSTDKPTAEPQANWKQVKWPGTKLYSHQAHLPHLDPFHSEEEQQGSLRAPWALQRGQGLWRWAEREPSCDWLRLWMGWRTGWYCAASGLRSVTALLLQVGQLQLERRQSHWGPRILGLLHWETDINILVSSWTLCNEWPTCTFLFLPSWIGY